MFCMRHANAELHDIVSISMLQHVPLINPYSRPGLLRCVHAHTHSMQVCSAAGAGGPRSSPAAVAIAPAPSPTGPRPLARAPVNSLLQSLDPRRSQILTSKRNRERCCWRVPDAAVPLRGGRARPHSTHTWPWEVRVTSRHPSPTSTGGRGRYTKPALDHEHKSTCASPCGGWPSAWP